MFSNKKIVVIATLLLVIIVVCIAYFVANKNAGLVAKVNGVGITTAKFDQSVSQLNTFYTVSNQTVESQAIQKAALDNLIDKQLIENYATENSITITDKQVETAYSQRVSTYNSEQEFLDTINKLYGSTKEQFKGTLRYDLLREAVQQSASQSLTDWLAEQKESANIKIFINL